MELMKGMAIISAAISPRQATRVLGWRTCSRVRAKREGPDDARPLALRSMLQRQKMESTKAPAPMVAMFSQRKEMALFSASTFMTTSGKVSAMNHTLTMSALRIMFMTTP